MKVAATSRVTEQNQISVPASVRRKFGIVAGTELVWEDHDGVLVVRPKRHSIDDLRKICADRPVRRRTQGQIREEMRRALEAKFGRD